MTIQQASVPLSSPHWASDQKVVTGTHRKRLREGRFADPAFGEQYWDLSVMLYRNNIRSMAYDFARNFPDPVRNLTARELSMQRLNAPVAPIQERRRARPLNPASIFSAMLELKVFYEFLDRNGIARLTEVDQDLLDRYLRHVTDLNLKRETARINVIYWLYESRSLLSQDRIEFAPWNGKPSASLFKRRERSENLTPRIPERVMDPLLRWSMKYIETFSNDIIALNCISELNTLNIERKLDSPIPVFNHYLLHSRVNSGLSHLSRAGSSIEPGRIDNPFSSALLKAAHPQLTVSAREQGINLAAAMDAIPSCIAEFGRPWRPPITSEAQIHLECRNLIAACYIVCAFLSGMRDSEIQAMLSEPISYLRDADDKVVRIYAVSKQFKGERAEGRVRTWVVLAPVEKAVSVMFRLGLITRLDSAEDALFTMAQADKSRRVNLFNRVNGYIREFIKHINSTLQPWISSDDLGQIPTKDERPITTRMFRRTIAWYIANRPFGIVAGTLQYAHASSQMFEGYAGSSASGFRQEVETERALARMADILQIYGDHKKGTKTAGAMAEALQTEFEYVRGMLGDFPGTIVDPGRRENMLSHLAKNFYPGRLADCFFEPHRAKCLEKTGSFIHDEPVRGLCDPHCENACWRTKHVPIWQHALTDIERLSRKNRLSPIQRDILRKKKAEYKAIIDAIEAASLGDAA